MNIFYTIYFIISKKKRNKQRKLKPFIPNVYNWEPMNYGLRYLPQSNSYLQSHEEKWVTTQCIKDKKIIAHHMLSWCKRVRDIFDDEYEYDASEIPEPKSIIDLDNWIDINNHYSIWETHVNVWRERFNKVYGITH